MSKRRAFAAGILGLVMAGCEGAEEPRITAIVGATVIDGTGAPPLVDGVILVSGATIRAVGHRSTTPIAARFDKMDARGRFVVPKAPPEVLAAATREGRLLLPAEQYPTIRAGQPAELLILTADPLADAANYRKVERAMSAGGWVDSPRP